jgi:hypothetical protein
MLWSFNGFLRKVPIGCMSMLLQEASRHAWQIDWLKVGKHFLLQRALPATHHVSMQNILKCDTKTTPARLRLPLPQPHSLM